VKRVGDTSDHAINATSLISVKCVVEIYARNLISLMIVLYSMLIKALIKILRANDRSYEIRSTSFFHPLPAREHHPCLLPFVVHFRVDPKKMDDHRMKIKPTRDEKHVHIYIYIYIYKVFLKE